MMTKIQDDDYRFSEKEREDINSEKDEEDKPSLLMRLCFPIEDGLKWVAKTYKKVKPVNYHKLPYVGSDVLDNMLVFTDWCRLMGKWKSPSPNEVCKFMEISNHEYNADELASYIVSKQSLASRDDEIANIKNLITAWEGAQKGAVEIRECDGNFMGVGVGFFYGVSDDLFDRCKNAVIIECRQWLRCKYKNHEEDKQGD